MARRRAARLHGAEHRAARLAARATRRSACRGCCRRSRACFWWCCSERPGRSRRAPRGCAASRSRSSCLLVAAALWATAFLVDDLIKGKGVSQPPSELLATGAVVWLGNNLAFALLYWLMDGGGPLARSRQPTPVDFAFTQHMSPELAPPGWRPVFLDYLHLGFTNATAFSPTDVMPLTHRAKYTMLVQSTLALALFGLIVARAVNAFT